MPGPAAPRPVSLRPADGLPPQDGPPLLDAEDLAHAARHATAVVPLLDWAARTAPRLPLPGDGRTVELWSALASVAAADVGAARVLEPHLDAVAVLAQVPGGVDLGALGAGTSATWGVFAAEGPDVRLVAEPTGSGATGWTLTGTKPWCSLATHLSHALVTAWVGDERRLFAVGLRSDDVEPDGGPWVARGLAQVVSSPVHFAGAPAVPVGAPGWYLDRPGFAWGGIGVAACWWGGAVGLARTLFETLRHRRPDPLAQSHLGAVDVALGGSRAALAEAAAQVDAGVEGEASALLARRVRTVVADAVETVQRRCARALGPGPLTTDETFARRVADLGLYVRQHHGERDEASQGRALLAGEGQPW
ncbi:acyl-CoA dehydrogenase [Isoptericola halotolerans]|uniref:acyl-CoA dehydrogenase n=1 Tax=Isoptericola halotolerans TaxID=300560 RepID=UPI00388D9923